MSRGWTWINENGEFSEGEIDALRPILDALANEWSAITREIEHEGWDRQARYDAGDYGPDCDEENCWAKNPCSFCREVADAKRAREATREVKLEIIEELLARHGARMMRPYEHWNEDERYMEYMENRP